MPSFYYEEGEAKKGLILMIVGIVAVVLVATIVTTFNLLSFILISIGITCIPWGVWNILHGIFPEIAEGAVIYGIIAIAVIIFLILIL